MNEQNIFKSYHTVSSYELDSFGHVNNAVFLNYLEKARCDYLLSRDLNFNEFTLWGKYPVVIKATLIFKTPAFAHDKLLINGWIVDHTSTRFSMKYEIINTATKQLLCLGETDHVFINEQNKPTRIPEKFKKQFLNII